MTKKIVDCERDISALLWHQTTILPHGELSYIRLQILRQPIYLRVPKTIYLTSQKITESNAARLRIRS